MRSLPGSGLNWTAFATTARVDSFPHCSQHKYQVDVLSKVPLSNARIIEEKLKKCERFGNILSIDSSFGLGLTGPLRNPL